MSEEKHDGPPPGVPQVVFGITRPQLARIVAGNRAALGLPPQPATTTPEPPMLTLYREALERLADEDTWILDEGLGGNHREELHVRASFAAHTLGRDTCGCSECNVSLGLEPDL